MNTHMNALPNDTSPIPLDLNWHGIDDATHIEWIADDCQSDMGSAPIDPSRPVELQMLALARELVANGHDGSGKIHLY